MLAVVGFLTAIIPAFTFTEKLYNGNNLVLYSTLVSALAGVIAFLILGTKFADKYAVRYFLIVFYGLTYSFWILFSEHIIIFACSYIACSVVVVYHDKKFTTVALTAVFVVNTVLFFSKTENGHIITDGCINTDCHQHFICTDLCLHKSFTEDFCNGG